MRLRQNISSPVLLAALHSKVQAARFLSSRLRISPMSWRAPALSPAWSSCLACLSKESGEEGLVTGPRGGFEGARACLPGDAVCCFQAAGIHVTSLADVGHSEHAKVVAKPVVSMRRLS